MEKYCKFAEVIRIICMLAILLQGVHTVSPLPHTQSVTICSWNLKDFGNSKKPDVISFIAATVNDYDIVMIQEVVAGNGGAGAVARLTDELNRKGAKWEYRISAPTFSSSYKTERYAFLWKPSRVNMSGRPWLEQKYKLEIDREPFLATFSVNSKFFTLVNFHAITKSKQPEREVKYFRYLPEEYPDLHLVFCGDFNLPQSHTVFNPLKSMGYHALLKNQKTSLKQRCVNDECLASEFDNAFYLEKDIERISGGIVRFYKSFTDLQAARKVSDHVPFYFEFSVR